VRLVEQKNGVIMRRLVGYGRFEGLISARALARLYAATRLQCCNEAVSLFQPSFKLNEKTRIGARVIALPSADSPTPGHAQAEPMMLLAEMGAAHASWRARGSARSGAGGRAYCCLSRTLCRQASRSHGARASAAPRTALLIAAASRSNERQLHPRKKLSPIKTGIGSAFGADVDFDSRLPRGGHVAPPTAVQIRWNAVDAMSSQGRAHSVIRTP
jgi:hypothetical protein